MQLLITIFFHFTAAIATDGVIDTYRDRITTHLCSPIFFSDLLDSPSDKLKRVPSSSSISSMGMVIVHHAGTMASGASLGTLPTLAYGSVYMKLWHGLTNLDSDPHPEVAKMSAVVTGYIRHQVSKHVTHFRM